MHVVTVDTRTSSAHRLNSPNGSDSTYVHNLGAGKKWEDLRTKVKIMRDWLQTKPMPPSDIVVFVDGDVMYGGCSLEEFKTRLYRILKVTNASIVFGVEAQCNDYNGDCKTDYPSKFQDTVLNEFSKTKQQMHQLTDDQDEKVGRCNPDVSPSKCHSHHELKFLNSGVYAGHAVRVLHFLKYWLLYMESALPTDSKVKLNPSDQASALLLLEQFPNSVTLDYATMLFSNLYGTKLKYSNAELYTWNKNTVTWSNIITRENVCFFHPNGNQSLIKYFAQHMY